MDSSKTDLAFFLPNLDGAGAERVLLNLANGMAARGYAIDVVVASAKGAFLEQVSPDITIVDLNAPRVFASIKPLAGYLKKVQPTVLLSAIHANFVAVMAQKISGAPTRIAVSQHAHITAYAQNSNNWRARLEPQFARLLFPQADHIIAVSNGVAESLTEASGIAPAKIDVIYNPVITPELAEKRRAPFQHPWFAGETRVPVMLAVGRLMAQKQFSDLIEAFAQVRANRQAKLIILGEGEERPRLEQQIQSLNLTEDVSLTGFVDNPYAYMANADLFVLSSIFEGLPTVMVEALYCDLPIVATDCPSGPYEILAGGRYGRLTPVGNPTKLAENILAALDGNVPQPTPESWQPYTMDFVIDQYLALLLPQTAQPAETVFGASAL